MRSVLCVLANNHRVGVGETFEREYLVAAVVRAIIRQLNSVSNLLEILIKNLEFIVWGKDNVLFKLRGVVHIDGRGIFLLVSRQHIDVVPKSTGCISVHIERGVGSEEPGRIINC